MVADSSYPMLSVSDSAYDHAVLGSLGSPGLNLSAVPAVS